MSENTTELYMKEARSWETDKVMELHKSKKTAWIVAVVASAIAFMSVLAVCLLTPLKRVDPFVIRVDNSTGVVDIVEALTDGKTNYEESVNKFFTQWYVRYREGYSKDLAEEYYSNVGLMSVGVEQQKYYEWFNPKNPQSPINVFGPYAKVKITIKSTSFINKNIALVRYTKAIERGLDKPQYSHWAATIVFKYTGAPMSEKDREINPLGFQVVEYRNDPDSMTGDAGKAATPVVEPTTANSANSLVVFPGQSTATSPVVPAPQQ